MSSPVEREIEIIEVTDIAVDAFNAELRPGDRVTLVLVDATRPGTITEVTKSKGELLRLGDGMATAEQPVTVTVRFDDGVTHTFGTSFLRLPSWRWATNELKRIEARAAPAAWPQGA